MLIQCLYNQYFNSFYIKWVIHHFIDSYGGCLTKNKIKIEIFFWYTIFIESIKFDKISLLS